MPENLNEARPAVRACAPGGNGINPGGVRDAHPWQTRGLASAASIEIEVFK